MTEPSEKRKPTPQEFSAELFGRSERWAVYAQIIGRENDVFRPQEIAAETGVHVSEILETALAWQKIGLLDKDLESDTFTRNPEIDWDVIDAAFAELSQAIDLPPVSDQ